jgi:hypothetical protein
MLQRSVLLGCAAVLATACAHPRLDTVPYTRLATAQATNGVIPTDGVSEPSGRAAGESHAASAIEVRQVEVIGGDVPNAAAVAENMVPRFRACSVRWGNADEGEVRVSAKVGPSGEVRMATPTSDEVSGMVVTCIAGEVAGAQFPAPTGAEPTVVIHVMLAAL